MDFGYRVGSVGVYTLPSGPNVGKARPGRILTVFSDGHVDIVAFTYGGFIDGHREVEILYDIPVSSGHEFGTFEVL